MWLQATISGPERGTFSKPEVRKRQMVRRSTMTTEREKS
jgi:hypothetical protein